MYCMYVPYIDGKERESLGDVFVRVIVWTKVCM